MLRLLETGYRVRYLHHDVGTREEFFFYLGKWKGRTFDTHPILYLGFHGSGGAILVGEGKEEDKSLTLSHLADHLEDGCKGRIIHFSSCYTVGASDSKLKAFRTRTRALAVCGYRKNVDWLESAAFDALVLGRLQAVSFRGAGSMRKFERELEDRVPDLSKRLGFRMCYGDTNERDAE